jgi:hypothetical protein
MTKALQNERSITKSEYPIFVAEVVEAGILDGEAKALDMWNIGWFYAG